MGKGELVFALFRKIKYARLNPLDVLTLDDLLRYRYGIIERNGVSGGEEHNDLELLDLLLRYYDKPYINDLQPEIEQVVLSVGFTDKIFEHLLPQLYDIIEDRYEWVCVFHCMIYYGLMNPVGFYLWKDWLNERLKNVGLRTVFTDKEGKPDGAHRGVPKCLRKSERYKWSEKEYCNEMKSDSMKTIKRFKEYCNVYDEVIGIFFGSVPHNDLDTDIMEAALFLRPI